MLKHCRLTIDYRSRTLIIDPGLELSSRQLLRRCGWWRRQVRQSYPVHCFPILGRNHLNRIPRTAVEKRSIRSFARAFLTADAKIRIDFDASEWRMIFVRHPEHAGFDRTVFDTCGRAGTASAAIRRDCEDARLLLAGSFAVADRHGPLLLDHVKNIWFLEYCHASHINTGFVWHSIRKCEPSNPFR